MPNTLLVIMGAGASFDSMAGRQPSAPLDLRPPLTNELFNQRGHVQRLLSMYPELQALAARVRGTLKDSPDLETLLDVVVE
ncbi:MAG TPA: hypothetical protein VIG99_32585, partial [Myxococcaceae bacterium]